MATKIEQQSHLLYIYSGRKGIPSRFRVVAPKEDGSSIGSIFEKEKAKLNSQEIAPLKRWLGKVGSPNQLLSTESKHVELIIHEMNLSVVGEKIASDCYKELSNGEFLVPKTCLSEQPIVDQFTQKHPKLQELLDLLTYVDLKEKGPIPYCLRIMSQLVEGYTNLGETYALDEEYKPILFCEYIKKFHRPPVEIISPEGVTVPLLGMMEVLAIGRILADPDVLGGNGSNAGVVWIKNEEQEIISAKFVKVDPGAAFSFNLPFQKNPNLVISALNNPTESEFQLKDVRDIQTSSWNHEIIIEWILLSKAQKNQFLLKLLSAKKYLEDPKVLSFLLYRDGMFNLEKKEMIPKPIFIQYEAAMREWLNEQMQIYESDINSL